MKIKTDFGLRILFFNNDLKLYSMSKNIFWDPKILSNKKFVNFLIYCEDWVDIKQAKNYLSDTISTHEYDPEFEINNLISQGILISDEDEDYVHKHSKKLMWFSYGWEEPYLFHWKTNMIPKMNYAKDPKGEFDKSLMKKYLSEEPPPSNYKNIDSVTFLPLEKNVTITEQPLTEIFTRRVEITKCMNPLSFEEFCWLTYLGFGETSSRQLPLSGRHVAKTMPSGGSRHPTEVYPVIFSVDEIPPGLYHYNVQKHGLELLQSGIHDEFIQRYVISHPKRPSFQPSVVFLFTSIFDRSMFRYRESRSYRVIHYDIGHIMQNFAYLASALDRSSYRGYSQYDDLVNQFLKLDGLNESIMAFSAIG